jgi:hypothetical protein
MSNEEREKLRNLVLGWESQAASALKNISIPRLTESEAEGCRTAHGYLLHCAGEVREILGLPRVIDEQQERMRASDALFARGKPVGRPLH